jgi:hypothetical protein
VFVALEFVSIVVLMESLVLVVPCCFALFVSGRLIVIVINGDAGVRS